MNNWEYYLSALSIRQVTANHLKSRFPEISSENARSSNESQGLNYMTLQCCHNGRDGVSNHQPHGCLLNRVFRHRSKKTSKLRVTGLCVGNSPVTGKFPAQLASEGGKCFHLMTSSWQGTRIVAPVMATRWHMSSSVSVNTMQAMSSLGAVLMFPCGILVNRFGYQIVSIIGALFGILAYGLIALATHTREFHEKHPFLLHCYFLASSKTLTPHSPRVLFKLHRLSFITALV